MNNNSTTTNKKTPVYVCSNSLAVGIAGDEVVSRPGGLGIGVRAAFEGESNYMLADWKGVMAYPTLENENKNIAKMEADSALLAGVKNSYLYVDPKARDSYYKAGVNGILWPLVHNMADKIRIDSTLEYYEEINKAMADEIVKKISEDDNADKAIVWVQDSHLASVPAYIKEQLPQVKVGYFHHTPFQRYPFNEITKADHGSTYGNKFKINDQRRVQQILKDVLKADSVAFHTQRDVDNFIETIKSYRVSTEENWQSKLLVNPIGVPKQKVEQQLAESVEHLRNPNELTETLTKFENDVISSSVAKVEEKKLLEQTVARMKKGEGTLHDLQTIRFKKYFDPNKIHIGSVQRSDYTKGVHEQLKAFRNTLINLNKEDSTKRPGDNVQLNMVCSSARDIPAFAEYESETQRLVNEINEEFPESVNYITGIPNDEVPAFNAANDIVTATSIQDGYILAIGEAIHARTIALQEGYLPLANQPSAAIVSSEAGIAVDLGGEGKTSVHPCLSLVEPTVEAIQQALEVQVRGVGNLRQSGKTNTHAFICISPTITDIKEFGRTGLDHLTGRSVLSAKERASMTKSKDDINLLALKKAINTETHRSRVATSKGGSTNKSSNSKSVKNKISF